MKILVVGSGGREHALCSAFSKSRSVSEIFCANGNAGISNIAKLVDIKPDSITDLAGFASENSVGLTFVGGETALALGIVDEFHKRGLPIIGPTREAAKLEASKSFAKDFMKRHRIPTAAFRIVTSVTEAVELLGSGEFGDEATPVVVKADGLAAGKGVVVAGDRNEAIAAVNELKSIVGEDAAETIVLEECLVGKEVSLIMFCDGRHYALMPPTRDHKRIGEGDTGPNTGGMGTFTDSALLASSELEEIARTIIEPTLSGCAAEGFAFRGILFLGLMMTNDGPRVLEYHVRFGDPETQAILVRLDSDLLEICDAILAESLNETEIAWRNGSSACVILASEGYPGKPRTGDVIEGIDKASGLDDVSIFHSGTGLNDSGEFITAGGRVLGVTATADTLDAALSRAYEAAGMISWPGMKFRRDIGK
jgi:phosphoribosylamine---glycine ligase